MRYRIPLRSTAKMNLTNNLAVNNNIYEGISKYIAN